MGIRRGSLPVRALKAVTSILIFAMAALTFVDVIGRYGFNAPIPGTFEIVGLLLGVITFTAFPLVTMEQQHITVGLFDKFFVGPARTVRKTVMLVASAAMVAFMSERLWATALDEAANDYVTEYFGISRAPLIYGLSALCAFTCVILLIMIVQYLRLDPVARARENQPPGEAAI